MEISRLYKKRAVLESRLNGQELKIYDTQIKLQKIHKQIQDEENKLGENLANIRNKLGFK